MIKKRRKIKEYSIIAFFGYLMGAANVIPGVSGGTMAFILGIYEELIESIRKFASINTFKDFFSLNIKKLFSELPWEFLLALGIGVMLALISLARVLAYTLKEHPESTYAAFFGLVLASVFSVTKQIKKWSFASWSALLIAAVTAFLIVNLVPVETPHVWWNLFLCGIIIICAMILPGISGSFLLLILGQYEYVLEAVNECNFAVLFWLGAGCVAGLGSFVHLMNWLFKKFHNVTVATLIGFMLGSLWKLWPWRKTVEIKARTENIIPDNFDASFYTALALAFAGFISVYFLENYLADNSKKERENDGESCSI